jgi:hypothetical protein
VRFLAYLDANSGSMIMAAIAGGLAGIAVVIKLWWRRITGLFMPSRRSGAVPDEAPAGAEGATATDVSRAPAQTPAEQ